MTEQVDVTGEITRIVGILRHNLENGDKRIAVESCNALIALLETGETPRDLSAARELHTAIETRVNEDRTRGSGLVRPMGPSVGLASQRQGAPSLELCIQFSEDGQHIRKWSRFPFEGGECLYAGPPVPGAGAWATIEDVSALRSALRDIAAAHPAKQPTDADVERVTQAIADAQHGAPFNGLEWSEAWAHFETLARAAIAAFTTTSFEQAGDLSPMDSPDLNKSSQDAERFAKIAESFIRDDRGEIDERNNTARLIASSIRCAATTGEG